MSGRISTMDNGKDRRYVRIVASYVIVADSSGESRGGGTSAESETGREFRVDSRARTKANNASSAERGRNSKRKKNPKVITDFWAREVKAELPEMQNEKMTRLPVEMKEINNKYSEHF